MPRVYAGKSICINCLRPNAYPLVSGGLRWCWDVLDANADSLLTVPKRSVDAKQGKHFVHFHQILFLVPSHPRGTAV